MDWKILLAPLEQLNDWELITLWNSYAPLEKNIYLYRHAYNLTHLEYIGDFVAWDEETDELTSFDFFNNYGSIDELAYWMYRDGWKVRNEKLWREL